MKKTPTVFERDWSGDKSRVVNLPNPECQWVLDGEGWPTKKIDGTCCMVKGGALYKRRELVGDAVPAGFIFEEMDANTLKTVGWTPVSDAPEDRWHREAFAAYDHLNDGTYELIGPKIQGNPEGAASHSLVSHASLQLPADVPRDFDGLRDWLSGKDMEGIVFHHPDGRMAKIKLRDFGLKRTKNIAA